MRIRRPFAASHRLDSASARNPCRQDRRNHPGDKDVFNVAADGHLLRIEQKVRDPVHDMGSDAAEKCRRNFRALHQINVLIGHDLFAARSNLLTGMLFDADGQPMTPTHAVKKGVRYRYYVSRRLVTGTRGEDGNRQTSGQRIPAANLEGLVIQRLRSFFADPLAVIESLPRHQRDAPSQKRATEATTAIVRALDDRREDAWDTIFRPMIARVQVRLDRIDVDLSAERLVERLLQTNDIDSHSGEGDFTSRRAEDDCAPAEPAVRLSLPAQLKRTGKEMKFVVQGDGDQRTADPSLVRLIVRAHRLARRLAENPGRTLEDVASQQNMGGPYAARLIRLNYLGPDIVAAILDGKQPVDLTANKLMADTRLPLDWRAQRAALRFA
jgi:site-specific DNA recombinase